MAACPVASSAWWALGYRRSTGERLWGRGELHKGGPSRNGVVGISEWPHGDGSQVEEGAALKAEGRKPRHGRV